MLQTSVQSKLPSGERTRKTKAARAEVYRLANETAARIVLADPGKYPGVMQEWAGLVLAGGAVSAADWRVTA